MSQYQVEESSNPPNNSFINSFNINSFNNTINYVVNLDNFDSANERNEILAWLSPLDPWIRPHAIRAQRVEHVGD